MSDAPSDPGQALAAPARLTWLPVAAQVALVTVLGAWLGCGLPVGIPGQWAWEVHAKPLPTAGLLRALVVGAGIIGLGALGLYRLRHRRRGMAWLLAGLVALVFAFQLSVASLAPQAGFYLVAGTGSSVATEYFSTAQTVRDPWAYCLSYAETQRSGHHVATHPPGAVLAYWICLRLYESPLLPHGVFGALAEQTIGAPPDQVAVAANSYPGTRMTAADVGPALFCCIVFGLCSALTVLPLYWLARQASTRSTALVVCCLFGLTPSPVLFFQGLDAPVMLLSVSALACAFAAVTRGRLAWGALCGLGLGLLSAVTFGATAALAATAALGVALLLRRPPGERLRAWAAVGAGAGVWLTLIVALHVACRGQLPAIFAQAMSAHRELTWEGMGRGYGTWVWRNLVEFGVFLGLPGLVVLAGAALGLARRRARNLTRVELVGLIGLGLLLLLNATGSVRGEVARVWLFLMPPLILWAGCRTRRALRKAPALAAATMALSLVQALVMGWTLTPVVLPY